MKLTKMNPTKTTLSREIMSLILLILSASTLLAQFDDLYMDSSLAFTSDYAVFQKDFSLLKNNNKTITEDLQSWDPIRGLWLAQSMEAMVDNRPVPDRMFPEDLTPYQMILLLPDDLRKKATSFLKGNGLIPDIRLNTKDSSYPCDFFKKLIGRSYGEPHLVTFEKKRVSFQTVGEYVLAKSSSGLEVQTRQKSRGGSFSINSAVAMNVNGDIIGIYAYGEGPNLIDSVTLLRINGQELNLSHGDKYFLANGGTVEALRDTTGITVRFTVLYPTGESVIIEDRRAFINITMVVSECGEYTGLLGSDTTEYTRRSTEFRLTPANSLFEYPIGKTTDSYTDMDFPAEIKTLKGVPKKDIDKARKHCEEAAIENNDMYGCLFDQVHLNIEPNPVPKVKDPVKGVVLLPVIAPTPNVNPIPSQLQKVNEAIEIKDLKKTPLKRKQPNKLDGQQNIKLYDEKGKQDEKGKGVLEREKEERKNRERLEREKENKRLEEERKKMAAQAERQRIVKEREAQKAKEKVEAEALRKKQEADRKRKEEAEKKAKEEAPGKVKKATEKKKIDE